MSDKSLFNIQPQPYSLFPSNNLFPSIKTEPTQLNSKKINNRLIHVSSYIQNILYSIDNLGNVDSNLLRSIANSLYKQCHTKSNTPDSLDEMIEEFCNFTKNNNEIKFNRQLSIIISGLLNFAVINEKFQ